MYRIRRYLPPVVDAYLRNDSILRHITDTVRPAIACLLVDSHHRYVCADSVYTAHAYLYPVGNGQNRLIGNPQSAGTDIHLYLYIRLLRILELLPAAGASCAIGAVYYCRQRNHGTLGGNIHQPAMEDKCAS